LNIPTAGRALPKCLLILLILLVLFSGCSVNRQQQNGPGPANNTGQNGNGAQNSPAIGLNMYFVKVTTDEAYLVREERLVQQTGDLPLSAVEKLISDPKSIFPKDTKVLGVTVEKGLATVNFSPEVLNNPEVGADGEELAIESVTDTLTEFPNIDKVAFQVEGGTAGPVMDWWGHVGLYEQPFTRDLTQVYEPAIWVTHPSENQAVGVPLLVRGSARVPAGTVQIHLLDSNGKVLAQGTAKAAAAAPGRGDFETSLKFNLPAKGQGVLEVFGVNPKDHSEQDKVTVPVQWP